MSEIIQTITAIRAREVMRDRDADVVEFIGDDGRLFHLSIADAARAYEGGVITVGQFNYIVVISETATTECSVDTATISETATTACSVDTATKEKDVKYVWSSKDTRLLLVLYKELWPLFEKKKIKYAKDVYEEISKKLKAEGYDVNATKVENRIKHLHRTYKDFNWNQNKTGQKTCFIECEDICHDLWAKKHNVNPPVILSSSKGIKIVESSKKDADLRDVGNELPGTSKSQSNVELVDDMIRDDEEREKLIENAVADSSPVPAKKAKKSLQSTKPKIRPLETCLAKIDMMMKTLQEQKKERETVNQHIVSCCKADEKLKNLQYTILMEQKAKGQPSGNIDQQQRNNDYGIE